MLNRVAAVLQASGVAVLSVAGWTITPTVGLFIAGAGMVLFGVAIERDA